MPGTWGQVPGILLSQAYHPGVDDLRAVPRIDIYGEDRARRVLAGEYGDMWVAPHGVTTMTVSLPGGGSGGNGCYTVAGNSGYSAGTVFAAGGGGSCNSYSGGAGGQGGNGSGWSSSRWSAWAYGSKIVRPGDIITITGGTITGSMT